VSQAASNVSLLPAFPPSVVDENRQRSPESLRGVGAKPKYLSTSMTSFSDHPYWRNKLLHQSRSNDWVVHITPPFARPEVVVHYLARYTQRIAISNHRLLCMENGNVTFSYKDYNRGANKTLTFDTPRRCDRTDAYHRENDPLATNSPCTLPNTPTSALTHPEDRPKAKSRSLQSP